MDDGKKDSHDMRQMVLQLITGLKNIRVNDYRHGQGLKREVGISAGI